MARFVFVALGLIAAAVLVLLRNTVYDMHVWKAAAYHGQPRPHGPAGSPRHGGPLRVAVCVTGHVRSMVSPGIVQEWEKYLLRDDDEVVTDLFLMPALGAFAGRGRWAVAFGPPTRLTDRRFKCAMEVLQPWAKYINILPNGGGGDCAGLQKVWRNESFCLNGTCRCCSKPNPMQMMRVDTCFRLARKRGDYDLFMRLRPDARVSVPINYSLFDISKGTGVHNRHNVDDHFFVVGKDALDTWWLPHIQYYWRCPGHWQAAPDSVLFRRRDLRNFSMAYRRRNGLNTVIWRGKTAPCASSLNSSLDEFYDCPRIRQLCSKPDPRPDSPRQSLPGPPSATPGGGEAQKGAASKKLLAKLTLR